MREPMVPAPSTAARRTRDGKATTDGEVVLMGALLRGMDLGAIHHAETIEGYGTVRQAVKDGLLWFDPAWSGALAWKSAGRRFCVLRTSRTRRPDAKQKLPLALEGRLGVDTGCDGAGRRAGAGPEEF